MKAGSKYWPLFDYLQKRQEQEIDLRFEEIERLLGQALPASARARRDWWGNRKSALQAAAWMQAGYHAADVEIKTERVVFRKITPRYLVRREGNLVLWNAPMIKALRMHLGFNQTQFADQLGVRQQTISEWENEIYAPSRATCKYLSLVAEQADFQYGKR